MKFLPTIHTDAAPPSKEARLVFLAGAIKWWWLSQCTACAEIGDRELGFADEYCTYGEFFDGKHVLVDFFGSRQHREYVKWRQDVRAALIHAGYLTYAPHEAFKGRWVEAAQTINDAGIKAADVMLVLSPRHAVTEGTDAEVAYAESLEKTVIYAAPNTDLDYLLTVIADVVA